MFSSNKPKVFRTLSIPPDKMYSAGYCIDYPEYLPIPAKGDIILYNDYKGKVLYINHSTKGQVTEINIVCENL